MMHKKPYPLSPSMDYEAITCSTILLFFLNNIFFTQKQVKINAGKIERRFGVVMTPFSSSKMIQINCQE